MNLIKIVLMDFGEVHYVIGFGEELAMELMG
jgi:hypothetical protein